MSELRRLISRSFMRHSAGFVALAVGVLLAASVSAQTLTNSFGGLSKSSKDPIDIESDVLVVHDSQKYATFKGNVKAVQGTTTLRARELNVHYTGGGDKPLADRTRKIAASKSRPKPRSPMQRMTRASLPTAAPRSPRSSPEATSSSPARMTRPRRATGPSMTCRRSKSP